MKGGRACGVAAVKEESREGVCIHEGEECPGGSA